MYYGADYYPEHWPEERWPEDARLMKEAGFNVVRMADLSRYELVVAPALYILDEGTACSTAQPKGRGSMSAMAGVT